jgi:peptidoglycan/xylan/chitin deacetylase (PgdA/CDA1 family)
MYIVALSFDDGFRRSFTRIAEIYEEFGLGACLNAFAAPEEMVEEQRRWGTGRGDFALWNELQERGHEIMPHGYRHARKTDLPFEEARDLITRALAVFSEYLAGFDVKNAVFNFPYGASTPELEDWLGSVVRAYRVAGDGINRLPSAKSVRLTATGHGPENCEWHLERELEQLFGLPEGWLIYNTHGLDDEGWGPIGSEYLRRLLDRLTGNRTVRVVPAATALRGEA